METMRDRGGLLTLEHVTAASNMAAGTLVALSGTHAYTLSSGSTGLGSTGGTLGYHFIGVLDVSVSAGQCPITVWTEGIFKLPLASGAISGSIYPGKPVWAATGLATTPGATGDMCIGSIVGIAGGTYGATGAGYVHVKIRPGALNWTIAATSALSATGPLPGSFPELAAR